jgi:hypothetical protein
VKNESEAGPKNSRMEVFAFLLMRKVRVDGIKKKKVFEIAGRVWVGNRSSEASRLERRKGGLPRLSLEDGRALHQYWARA